MRKAIAPNDLSKHNIKAKRKIGHAMAAVLGASVGVSLGGVLWMILAQRGYPAVVAGAFIALGAFKGYQWGGGKTSVFGSVFCMILSAGAIFLVSIADWGVFVYRTYHHDYDITYWDALWAVPDVLQNNHENMKAFARDLLLGLSFAVGGGILGRAAKTGISTKSEKSNENEW